MPRSGAVGCRSGRPVCFAAWLTLPGALRYNRRHAECVCAVRPATARGRHENPLSEQPSSQPWPCCCPPAAARSNRIRRNRGRDSPGDAATATDKVVNVYNWSDYIDPRSSRTSRTRPGIKVRYDVFDSNEVLETKLLSRQLGLRRRGAERVLPRAPDQGGRVRDARQDASCPNWPTSTRTLAQRRRAPRSGQRHMPSSTCGARPGIGYDRRQGHGHHAGCAGRQLEADLRPEDRWRSSRTAASRCSTTRPTWSARR